MTDPRQSAAKLLGSVDWYEPTKGFCACPGQSAHTSRNGKKDCRVAIDGAPTIYCVHASCAPIVAEANKRLRRELGGHNWEIVLPGGRRIRSGDVVMAGGAIKPRELVKAEAIQAGIQQNEKALLDTIAVMAQSAQPQIMEKYHWPLAEIAEASPVPMDIDDNDQFRAWLISLWLPHHVIWVGETYDSGKPEHAQHFRTVQDWYSVGQAIWPFTAGCAFKKGSIHRNQASMNCYRHLVIESDSLNVDEMGAIFLWLNRRRKFDLKAIVYSGGKSLHGWFDKPASLVVERRIKAELVALGCDPKVFTYSQPVRVPGATRDNGKVQQLWWLKKKVNGGGKV